jgi:hypothetical protein
MCDVMWYERNSCANGEGLKKYSFSGGAARESWLAPLSLCPVGAFAAETDLAWAGQVIGRLVNSLGSTSWLFHLLTYYTESLFSFHLDLSIKKKEHHG